MADMEIPNPVYEQVHYHDIVDIYKPTLYQKYNIKSVGGNLCPYGTLYDKIKEILDSGMLDKTSEEVLNFLIDNNISFQYLIFYNEDSLKTNWIVESDKGEFGNFTGRAFNIYDYNQYVFSIDYPKFLNNPIFLDFQFSIEDYYFKVVNNVIHSEHDKEDITFNNLREFCQYLKYNIDEEKNESNPVMESIYNLAINNTKSARKTYNPDDF